MREYLREFLSDPRVVALPRWLWLPILHLIVLRTRPGKSAEKYAQVWTAEGSPLKVHTVRQAALLREKTGLPVDYAMRYGEPSIRSRFREGMTVVPLYPQFAVSTTETIIDLLPIGTRVVREFHQHPAYIDALAAVARRHRKHAKLVMSFHGLPKRGGEEYERQCHATGRLLAERLGLPKEEWLVTFQSRFGAAEWLQPYTQPTLEAMARAGTRQVDVFCPGFVSDCLETLEELGITAREAFLAAGGTDLNLLPCLNEAPEWIAALEQIAATGRSSSE